MTDLYAALDQLCIAMSRANRVITRLGGKPLPCPTWLQIDRPPWSLP